MEEKNNKQIVVLACLIVLVGVYFVSSVIRSGQKESELTEKEIAQLREQYPMVDDNPAMVESIRPGNWGASFDYIFDVGTAVVTGKIISDVTSSNTVIHPVNLEYWEGTMDNFYWSFEVDEVLWINEEQKEQIHSGDKLLFHDSAIMFHYEVLLQKDTSYLLLVHYNPETGLSYLSRNGGFYITDDGYLLSFVSGENSSQYNGKQLNVYKRDLEQARKNWKRLEPGESRDYLRDSK